MTARAWLMLFAILNALCGVAFKFVACEIIFVITLVVLFATRNSVE